MCENQSGEESAMIKIKKSRGIAVAALIPILSSCGFFGPDQLDAKTCATDETASALKQVIFSNAKSPFASEAVLQELSQRTEVTLENAVASSLDEKLGRVDCEGKMTLRFPSDLRSPFLPKNGISQQIRFSVQTSADQESLVYTIYGGDKLTSSIPFAGMLLQGAKRKKTRTERTSVSSALPAPVPTSAPPQEAAPEANVVDPTKM
jgi:hypothetical protein